MNEISIAKEDIAAVASWIEQHAAHFSNETKSEEASLPSAIKVIRCVLSLRTSYDKVVVRRERTFRKVHPDIKNVAELACLIASFPTPYDFMKQELDYNSERKAMMLQQVVRYLYKIVQKSPNVPEEDSLKSWAIDAKPQDCYSLDIKYFKVAGFQYLRMLFGADTTKPDKHIICFLSGLLSRNVSEIESILLLEAASKRVRVSVRDADDYIWKKGARHDENG